MLSSAFSRCLKVEKVQRKWKEFLKFSRAALLFAASVNWGFPPPLHCVGWASKSRAYHIFSFNFPLPFYAFATWKPKLQRRIHFFALMLLFIDSFCIFRSSKKTWTLLIIAKINQVFGMHSIFFKLESNDQQIVFCASFCIQNMLGDILWLYCFVLFSQCATDGSTNNSF